MSDPSFGSSHPSTSRSKYLMLLMVLATVISLFFYALNNPLENWDMLGYIASVVSLESSNPEFIHHTVFSSFKNYTDPAIFKELTALNGSTDGSYRQVMYQDPEAFLQQIPFYQIRILLVLLILLATKLGFSLFVAAHFISAMFTSLAILIFYLAYRPRVSPVFWLLLPVLIYAFKIHEFAGHVTADSMAFLWLALISHAFIREHWKLLFFWLVSSVLVRTDLIVLVAFIAAWLLLFKPEIRVQTLLMSVIAILMYVWINNVSGNHGWSTVFYYAVISDMKATHPLEYSKIGVTLAQYWQAVSVNVWMFWSGRQILFFEAAILVYFFLVSVELFSERTASTNAYHLIKTRLVSDPVLVLAIISVLYYLAHYLLFPLLFERFFIGQFLLISCSLLVALSELKLEFKPKENTQVSIRT